MNLTAKSYRGLDGTLVCLPRKILELAAYTATGFIVLAGGLMTAGVILHLLWHTVVRVLSHLIA